MRALKLRAFKFFFLSILALPLFVMWSVNAAIVYLCLSFCVFLLILVLKVVLDYRKDGDGDK